MWPADRSPFSPGFRERAKPPRGLVGATVVHARRGDADAPRHVAAGRRHLVLHVLANTPGSPVELRERSPRAAQPIRIPRYPARPSRVGGVLPSRHHRWDGPGRTADVLRAARIDGPTGSARPATRLERVRQLRHDHVLSDAAPGRPARPTP